MVLIVLLQCSTQIPNLCCTMNSTKSVLTLVLCSEPRWPAASPKPGTFRVSFSDLPMSPYAVYLCAALLVAVILSEPGWGYLPFHVLLAAPSAYTDSSLPLRKQLSLLSCWGRINGRVSAVSQLIDAAASTLETAPGYSVPLLFSL